MSEKRYVVRLTEDERSMLSALVKKEKGVAARKRLRAQVLLKVDQGPQGPAWTDEETRDALDIHLNTVHTIRRDLVEQGLDVALERRPLVRPSRRCILDAGGEKELIAIAQSDPPKGRARWTLHLLAGRMIELKFVDAISHETVRKTLKKTLCSPTSRSRGSSRQRTMGSMSRAWRMCLPCTNSRLIRPYRCCAWMNSRYN